MSYPASRPHKQMDRSGDFQELITCPICMETMSDARNLPCGHTFCLECLETYQLYVVVMSCPICRQKFPIPDASTLPKNYPLQRLIEAMRECDNTAQELHSDSSRRETDGGLEREIRGAGKEGKKEEAIRIAALTKQLDIYSSRLRGFGIIV